MEPTYECCLCLTSNNKSKRINLSRPQDQDKLDSSKNFCSLLNLPIEPFGEDFVNLYSCPNCNKLLKASGKLLKKLEEITAQISKSRNFLLDLVFKSQLNAVETDSLSINNFRQSLIARLMQNLNSSPCDFIKEEILDIDDVSCNYSPLNEETSECTDFEDDDPKINGKSSRKRKKIKPENDPNFSNSESNNNEDDFHLKRKIKKKSENKTDIRRKNSLSFLSPSEIENLKKSAINSIAKVSLRPLESLSRDEISQLIKSTRTKKVRIRKSRKRHLRVLQEEKVIYFGAIKFDKIMKENGDVHFKCLVPGCGKILRDRYFRKDHLYDHFPERVNCPLCPKNYPNVRGLRRHLRQGRHKEKNNDLLDKVMKEYKMRMLELATHSNSINNNSAIQILAQVDNSKSALVDISSEIKPAPMRIIAEEAIKFENLRVGGQVHYKCLVPGCGKVLKSRNCRYDHKFEHFPETIDCPLCPLPIKNPRHLRQHLRQGKHKLTSYDLYIKTMKEYKEKLCKMTNYIQLDGPF